MAASAAAAWSMYVRVKRGVSTWFVACDATDTAASLKRKLAVLTEASPDDQRLVLVATGALLEDSKTLAEQRVDNDCVVALTFQLPDGQGWEEVSIERPEDHGAGLEGDM